MKSKSEKEIKDDVFVRREDISKLFHPPPDRSTFYRWVNQRLIVKARGINGYFLLNATRVRLGMNEIDVKAYREGLGSPQKERERAVESPDEKPPETDLRVNPPALMSVKEAAAYLTISPATMHREIKARRVNVVRLGRRVLLRKKDLDIYIENNLEGNRGPLGDDW